RRTGPSGHSSNVGLPRWTRPPGGRPVLMRDLVAGVSLLRDANRWHHARDPLTRHGPVRDGTESRRFPRGPMPRRRLTAVWATYHDGFVADPFPRERSRCVPAEARRPLSAGAGKLDQAAHDV